MKMQGGAESRAEERVLQAKEAQAAAEKKRDKAVDRLDAAAPAFKASAELRLAEANVEVAEAKCEAAEAKIGLAEERMAQSKAGSGSETCRTRLVDERVRHQKCLESAQHLLDLSIKALADAHEVARAARKSDPDLQPAFIDSRAPPIKVAPPVDPQSPSPSSPLADKRRSSSTYTPGEDQKIVWGFIDRVSDIALKTRDNPSGAPSLLWEELKGAAEGVQSVAAGAATAAAQAASQAAESAKLVAEQAAEKAKSVAGHSPAANEAGSSSQTAAAAAEEKQAAVEK